MPRCNSNIAIGSLPALQILLGIVALLEKIYDGDPILAVVSNIEEDGSIESMMCIAARHNADIEKQLLISNDRNRVREAVLGFLQDGACTDLF
jgi:hypothetical protein